MSSFLPIVSKGQVIETETVQTGWVTTGLGPYSSVTWNDNTAGGAMGRYPSTTSFRMMYLTIANAGISPGFYTINVRWYDANSEATSILYFQIGSRTCYGTSTTVCNTGTFAVDDQWAVDAGAGLFGMQSYSGVNVAAGDTIFYYFKQSGGSPRGWIDYIEFSPAFPNVNPPIINNQSFTINENSSGGTAAGTVAASDPDAGQSVVTYSITAGNTGGVFSINNSGVITANGPLDYESIATYPLTVQVCDNGTPSYCSSATVTITINDVFEAPNNFDPVITNAAVSRSIEENSNGGAVVGTALAATDGDGNTVTYSITGGNTGNVFYINSTTGQIYVNGPLDYEALSSYSLSITATDNGIPSRNSTSTVVINITDMDESSPSLSAWYGACSGTTVPVMANPIGAIFAGWEISGGGTADITSPSSASTTVTNHLASVSYIAKAVVPSGPNLVTNGDFEAGTSGCSSCIGFSSSYTYDATVDSPGEYGITQNADASQSYFASSGDHTTGFGWYLYADGASSSGAVIYQSTVSVVSGQSYSFSAWFANGHDGTVNSSETAHLEFMVAGMYTGDINLPLDVGTWHQFTSAYTASSTGSIIISIVNRNTNATKNDFFLDDISFRQAALLTQTITAPACPDPLPVQLTHFTGEKENSEIVLNWIISSENNNDYFILERSLNGKDFVMIGTVAGKGNATGEATYRFEDPEIIYGTLYYRLLQVDLDGSTRSSSVIVVHNENDTELEIYPNPNNGSFFIRSSGHMGSYKIEIVNLEGQLIYQNNGMEMPLLLEWNNFPSGMYMVNFYYDDQFLFKKLLIY